MTARARQLVSQIDARQTTASIELRNSEVWFAANRIWAERNPWNVMGMELVEVAVEVGMCETMVADVDGGPALGVEPQNRGIPGRLYRAEGAGIRRPGRCSERIE